MPKQTTPAMEAHIKQEVTTLAHCIYIEQKNGRIIRMTDHDQNIVVGGETYFSTIGFHLSAIESTAGLAVDNASIRVGVDGVVFRKADFTNARLTEATFGIFIVNWQDPDSGTIWMKKGFVGKAQWSDTKDEATLELLGMTAAMAGKSIEQYSPTCRAQLGDVRCGVCNLPNRIRSAHEQFTTGNWFMVPANTPTDMLLSNSSWEVDGEVALGLTGISNWSRTPGSQWAVESGIQANNGTYYVRPDAMSDYETRMWQEVTTSSVGITGQDIIDGKVLVNLTCSVTPLTQTRSDMGRCHIFIEAQDINGAVLQRVDSRRITKRNAVTYGEWLTISAPIMLHPDTKKLRYGIVAGPGAQFGFDNMQASYILHAQESDFSNRSFKTVKLFNSSGMIDPTSSAKLQNNRFSQNGLTANTEAGENISYWTAPAGSFWRTSSAEGVLQPERGQFMLVAGDNGSSTPNTEYVIKQRRSVEVFRMDSADVAGGWWYTEGVVWYTNLNDDKSRLRFSITFLDSTGTTISTITSPDVKSPLVNQWTDKPLRFGGTVPVGTQSIEMAITVTSGDNGSLGNMAIDMVDLAVYPIAYEGALDPDWGQLSSDSVTHNTSPRGLTVDGEILVQANDMTFGYGQVSGAVSGRAFTTTNITFTPASMYTGTIHWLTGKNAGTSSIVRIFDVATGQVSLYENLVDEPQIGDRFIYSKGCDKTIDTCADVFNNAINFRGESYLPGEANIIDFLTQG